MKPEITVFGARASGARALGLRPVEGIEVLITPASSAENDAAVQLANRIADQSQETATHEFVLAAKQNEIDALTARLKTLSALLSEERAISEAARTGRRSFFGPVLMKPVAGDWAGEVWLMDPTKQERGLALRFKSVAEVRSLHPELWITSVSDNGVMLDAWGSR